MLHQAKTGIGSTHLIRFYIKHCNKWTKSEKHQKLHQTDQDQKTELDLLVEEEEVCTNQPEQKAPDIWPGTVADTPVTPE